MEFVLIMCAIVSGNFGFVNLFEGYNRKLTKILFLMSICFGILFVCCLGLDYKEFKNEHVKTNTFEYSPRTTIKSDKVFDVHTIVQKPFKLSWSNKTKITIKIGDETIIIYEEM